MEDTLIAPEQAEQQTTGGDDKLKALHEAVSKDYDVGTFDEFKTKMQDPAKQKAFYDGVGSHYDLGSFDDFKKKLNTTPPATPAKPIPVKPNPNLTPDEQLKAVIGKTDEERAVDKNAAQTATAQQHLSGIVNNPNTLNNLATKIVTSDTKQQMISQFGNTQSTDATGNTGMRQQTTNQINNAGFLPISQEQIDGYKKLIQTDPKAQWHALNTYANDNPAEATAVRKSQYLVQRSQQPATPDQKIQQSENADLIEKKKLKYIPGATPADPGKLVQPMDFGESLTHGLEDTGDKSKIFDLADSDNLDPLIYELNQRRAKNNNPDIPQKVPAGVGGALGDFTGSNAKGIGGGVALNAVPVAGQYLATGWFAHTAAIDGYSTELERTYNELKNKGVSDELAAAMAKDQAKKTGIVDAVVGGALGVMGGEEKAAEALQKPNMNLLQKAWDGIPKKLAGELPTALKLGGIAAAGQGVKNVITGRDVSEGMGDAFSQMAMLHLANQTGILALSKAKDLAKGTAAQVRQMLIKIPETDLNATVQDLQSKGILTADEGEKTVNDINQQKEVDSQIPANVINENVRIDLQGDIRKRNDLEEELGQVAKTFHPAQKEKIATLDERILEKANSPEAKTAPVEDKAVSPATGKQEKAGDEDMVPATASDDAPLNKEQPLETKNNKVVYEDGNRVAYDKDGEKIPQFITQPKEGGKPGEMHTITNDKWRRVMSNHAENYNYDFGEKAPEPTQEFKDSSEAANHFIEQSNNPAEIAQAYKMHEKQPAAMDSKEYAIANSGIGKVKPSSFDEFNDSNNRTNAIARRYFGSEKTGRTLDNIAEEISDHSGVQVSPEDVTHYMQRFANVDDPLKPRNTQIHEAAQEKFEKLTGIPLTDKVATMAVEQLHAKEIPKGIEHTVTETEAMPEDQKLKWLQETEKSHNFDEDEQAHQIHTGVQGGADEQPEGSGGDQQQSPGASGEAHPGDVQSIPDEQPDKNREHEALSADFDEYMHEPLEADPSDKLTDNEKMEKISSLEKDKQSEIDEAQKPEVKINRLSATEKVNLSAEDVNAHDRIWNKYKDLKKIIPCLWP